MLFYLKKYLVIELFGTLILALLGYFGMDYFQIQLELTISWFVIIQGLTAFILISIWNFSVQFGYRLFKGKVYSEKMTKALAKHFSDSSMIKAIAAGLTAACGEEIFFRGFVQGQFGIVASTLVFGLMHIGKKDIRHIGFWSFFQGFFLCLSYELTGNLLVPMIAHGLFDIGGVLYFRKVMEKDQTALI